MREASQQTSKYYIRSIVVQNGDLFELEGNFEFGEYSDAACESRTGKLLFPGASGK